MKALRLSRRTDIATVHDVARPFYRFTQPFGFLCIDLRNGKLIAITASCVSVVGLLLNGALSGYCLLGTLPSLLQPNSGRGLTVLRKGFQFTFFCTTITQLIGNLLSVRHRRRFVKLLFQLERIDEQLATLKLGLDHWQHYRYVCIGCVYFGLVMMAVSLATAGVVMTNCGGITSYAQMFMAAAMSAYVQLAYCSLLAGNLLGVLAIRMRVDALNGRIERLDVRSSDAWTVQRLARVWDGLCDSSDTLNEGYAAIVVGCMGTAFVSNITYIFSLYTMLAHAQHMRFDWMLPLSLVWNAHIQVWTMWLAFAGDTMAAAGRRTGQLIHRQMNAASIAADGGGAPLSLSSSSSGWRPVERQLEHFSAQVLHRCPVAHTRLFAVDCTLVYAVRYII